MRPLLLAFIVMMLSCKNPSQTLDIVNSRTHRIKLVQVTYPGGDHRITYSPTTGQPPRAASRRRAPCRQPARAKVCTKIG